MKKLFASLAVALAAMCFAPQQVAAAELCTTEKMTTTTQEVQVDVERGVVVIVEETVIMLPDGSILVIVEVTVIEY